MNTDELDRILKHTLTDFRLSRGERRVLSQVINELDADDQRMAWLRSRAFDIARAELNSPDAVGVLQWLEEVIKVMQPAPKSNSTTAEAYFSPGDNCAGKIANLFFQAQRKVDVCVFTITDDRISDAIVDAHRRDVVIRIISDNDKAEDAGSDVELLRRRGIEVRVDQSEYHMHHKFAVFDNRWTLTGSYNWTRGAAVYNEENFIVTDDADLTRSFSQAFERMWKSFA